MAYLCFHCDAALPPEAKFCHQCGSPTFSSERAPEAAAGAAADARSRIRDDVKAAVRVPTLTRMAGTLLPPGRAAAPPFWREVLAAPFWRRPALWVALGAVVVAVALTTALGGVVGQRAERGAYEEVLGRLARACSKDSREQIAGYVARIQAASTGEDTLLDSALLLEFGVRGVAVPQGDCSRIAEALARPDRFERLLH